MWRVGRRVSSPAFVGRGEQLEALGAAVSRAGAGEAGAVFIGGEAGVGKTRLVREFERLPLASGVRFLVGGCVDVGGSELPYAPLLAALRTLMRETEPHVLEELVGAAGPDLARLMPELPFDGAGGDAVGPLAQSRLFEALLGLFARLGRDTPIVLVIEDLHWADPSTRGFLSFLVRNARHERLLLIATYRTDELHRRHPLRQFLAEVDRLPAVERLELVPFTRRELSQQLEAILDAPPGHTLVEELFARSEGNAFFAEELLAAVEDDGSLRVSESLRDVLTLRVEGLSPQTRQIVRSAAVAGSVVGHRLLEATASLTEDELLVALREAVESNVLVPNPAHESYAFRHTLLRDALYDELLPRERAALHAALARALERDPGVAAGAHGAAAQRAMHWSAAHELAAALAASVQAGVEAETVWAFAEANGHFEHAAELWERVADAQRPSGLSLVDLLRRAAEAAYLSGENQRAGTLIRSVLELLDHDRDRAAVGLAHERLARYLLADALLRDALREYRTAASLLPAEPSAARASILAGEAHILMLEGQSLQARAPCEEAVRIAHDVGAAEVECDALNTLGAVLTMLGAPQDGLDALRRGMQLAEELGALEELRRAYINLGQSLDDAGRLEEAAELARAGWERLRPGLPSGAPFLASEAGRRLTRLGRWQDALTVLEEAAETARPNLASGMVHGALAALEATRGEVGRASAHLQSARQLIPRDSVFRSMAVDDAAGELALARGNPEELRQIVDLDARVSPNYPPFLVPGFTLALRAEADLAQRARTAGDDAGEREGITRAHALMSHVQALIRPDTWRLGSPPQDTTLEVELCTLEASRAQGETHADAWAAHAARWDGLGRPYRAAYARFREAEAALLEKLPRPRIVAALTSARSTATRLGAQPLLDDIELVSRRARLRAAAEEREDAPAEVAGLTARERDVLRLIAEGRTNPEIGKALYMSPKTASVHVSRILSKLDVKTRTEAAGVAHRLGLLDTSGARPNSV
jgi:DNA-binding CsgD family transcriptional regulator